MHFLVTICLMFCGVGTALCNTSSERFTFNRTTSHMETFINAKDFVYHMDADQYIEGNLLFSDLHSLKTTDGQTTQIVAGDASNRGYREGKGGEVRFRYVTAFCQINKTTVVVVDNGNHCLRVIDRLSGQTRTFSGTCTRYGFADGSKALFYHPRGIIIDNQDKSKLLVTDEENKAVRQVDTSTGAVTTFFVDQTLNYLLGITQKVSTGDLYLTSYSDIYTLNYQNKELTLIAGSHRNENTGGDFFAVRFDKPRELLLLDGNRKLIITDEGNERLIVLDMESNTASSLCTGSGGHRDGDLESCSLDSPRSLLVIGDTLYIGEDQRIRNISGITLKTPTTTPTTTTTSSTTPKSKITMTPPTKPTTTPTLKSTTMPTKSPMPMSLCKRGNITMGLQPGEKTVNVETEPGRTTRLPTGEYLFMFTSNLENCSIHVYVTKEPSQDLCSAVTEKDYRISASESGLGDLDITCGDVVHRLSLPVGEYKYQKLHKDGNCSALIDVKDKQLVRRLNIKAEYNVPCDLLTDPVTKSSVTAVAESHFVQIEGPTICGTACSKQKGGDIKLTCVNMTLSILWPTDQTYGGHITNVPVRIQNAIKLRLKQIGGPSLKIFIISLQPPVVLPARTDVVLKSSCVNNKLYSAETDSCI